MSDTFPAVPADMLMQIVDDSLEYTGVYRQAWGYYFRQGRNCATVALADSTDTCAEVISAGCYGRSKGADQAVWVFSAISDDWPVGDPYLVMIYTDELGAQLMRRRKLAIYDSGAVGPAGCWEDRSVEDSRMVIAASVPWALTPGDPNSIRQLLTTRGHYISP
jgi:hypothetical protein